MTYFNHFRSALRPLLMVGCAAILSSCTDGMPQSNRTLIFGDVDRELSIQPIRVCDDAGQNCAQMNLFADVTAKILAQARLKVNFLPVNQLNRSRFLIVGDQPKDHLDEFYELARSGKNADYGRHPNSTFTTGPLNVWFVDSIHSDSGSTQFGSAWVDRNGIVISEATVHFNGGKGRPDTLAHEIGHNLGLKHTTLGAGDPNNLLTSGTLRNVPGDVNDVYPDGAGISHLTSAQLQEIFGSPFVSVVSTDSVETIAADLSRISLTSLQLSTAPAASVPEPPVESGLGLLGLASMPLLRRKDRRRKDRRRKDRRHTDQRCSKRHSVAATMPSVF